MRTTLGTTFGHLGEFDTATDQFTRARELYGAHAGPHDPRTLEAMYAQANCLAELDRYPEALALHQETLDLRRAVLGPDHPDTLRGTRGVGEALNGLALQRYFGSGLGGR